MTPLAAEAAYYRDIDAKLAAEEYMDSLRAEAEEHFLAHVSDYHDDADGEAFAARALLAINDSSLTFEERQQTLASLAREMVDAYIGSAVERIAAKRRGA